MKRVSGALLDAALEYARRGVSVFPVWGVSNGRCACGAANCAAPGKHPLGVLVPRGFKEATTEEAGIQAWWARFPDANVGIVTGSVSDVIVLDVDGPAGWESLKRFAPVPVTWRTSTARGEHLYFKHPGGVVANFAKRVPGLDLRGDGGYVVAPPSEHSSGARYAWVIPPDEADLAECPAWLLDLVTHPGAGDGHGERFVLPERVQEGARNDTLYRLARALKAKGLGPAAILAALEAENAARCEPPLPTGEVREIAKHAAVQTDRPEFAPMSGEAEHLTDLGNARRLVRQHGQDLRYCTALGWLVWDGRRWARDETGEVMRRAKQTVQTIYAEAAACPDEERRKALAGHARRSEAEPRLRAMVNLAESEPGIPVIPPQLDVDPFALTVLNGTIDLKAGVLRPSRREDLITKLVPVAYDPRAPHPIWSACLDRILPDPALRSFVQKAVGNSLTGDTREQVLYILHGTGSNGKTTLLTTVTTLLSGYARWTPTETLLVKRGDAIPNDIARLHGARLVAAAESEGGRRLAEALVKQITGGDTLTARFLHREFFEFRPSFKLWLAVNHKPEIRGTDHAMWRRIRLIPFTVTIPEEEQDRGLAERLNAELPGILRWAVEGCLAWQREGLGTPEAVKIATERYQGEMDALGEFLDERCAVTPEGTVTSRALYDAYVAWCVKSGERTLTRKMFGLRLAERGFRQDRTRAARTWSGLFLEDGNDEPEPAWARTSVAREEYEL